MTRLGTLHRVGVAEVDHSRAVVRAVERAVDRVAGDDRRELAGVVGTDRDAAADVESTMTTLSLAPVISTPPRTLVS